MMRKIRIKRKKKIRREIKKIVGVGIEAVTKAKAETAKGDAEPKVEAKTVIDGNRDRKVLDLFSRLMPECEVWIPVEG